MPKRNYTSEEARIIVVGLVTGKRPGYRPMPDAEYEARVDPEGAQQKRMLATLERIATALETWTEAEPPRQARPWQPPQRPTAPSTGTVPLE